MQTNSNFLQVLDELTLLGEAATHKPSEDPLYQQFIERYPAARLPQLSLAEYCVGKGGGDSFCWWLERGLQPLLGRYMPGTSRGHILYFSKDGTVYKHRYLKALSDQEALEYTLRIQACIAQAEVTQDLRWIDDDRQLYQRAGVTPRVTFGDGRKLRLLSCYHPDDTLPISSSSHIGHFLTVLGCPSTDIPSEDQPVARMLLLQRYYELAKESITGLTPSGFMRALYSERLGLAPAKEEDAADDAGLDEGNKPAPNNNKPAGEEIISAQPLNQILYGPPGTGKTHSTIDAALAILDPEYLAQHRTDRAALKSRFDTLAQEQRVHFVTFHQSFSYEDFVEGLRATTDENTQELRYEVVDGVFKSICIASLPAPQATTGLLPLGPIGASGYTIARVTDDLVELTKPNGNHLPFSQSMLKALAEGVKTGRISIADIRNKQAVDKLPGMGLEPFLVNGYNNILAPLVDLLCSVPTSTSDSHGTLAANDARVLIIDEINRGNISRIFGELITLIEPTKRTSAEEALEVVLPYSKQPFSVPKNVFLIGTMNTADRSLTAMDVALRRRFVFKEMLPRPGLLANVMVGSIPIDSLLTAMNARIEALLDRDHCLGHAYFMPLRKDNSAAKLAEIFRIQVLPLLQEYFFDDWQRIQWVLNDHRKRNEAYRFVTASTVDTTALFGDEVNIGHSAQLWHVNEDAFICEQSYLGVINHEDAAE